MRNRSKSLRVKWIRISRLKSIACDEFLANQLILKRHEKENEEKKVEELLAEILEHQRGSLAKIEDENKEYDEEFAKIGKSEEESENEEGKE